MLYRMFGFLVLLFCGCGLPPPLPPVEKPAAGYWYDDFRARRMQLPDAPLLAGAARVKITPDWHGLRIAGHGHFRKHAKGKLDDLFCRVLYIDSGERAVVLVSVDFIGWPYHRLLRVRERITRNFGQEILIAATHNHAGPDTEGLWGPALLGLLPVKNGVDREYLEWVEKKMAQAILKAVARARPARLYAGRVEVPEGLAVNLREPEDLPRQALVLRAADTRDGFSIGTVVVWGNHAESLQDKSRWLSADWPGVLCRELELALGGVALFFSGPAGGMIEPANHPDDPEEARLAFREKLGGAVAGEVIRLVIGGLEQLPRPKVRLAARRLELELEPGGTIELAMKLGLLEPRPMAGKGLISEMALVDLGAMQLLFVPGELTPEVGRSLEKLLPGPYVLVITLGLDHLGYMISDRQWQDQRFEYERQMSLGPKTTSQILQAATSLASELCSKTW